MNETPRIATASWFAPLPDGCARVGISRGVPRNLRGYTRHRALEPGPWFKSVSPTEYLTRYADILARLDPHDVADRLTRVPVRP